MRPFEGIRVIDMTHVLAGPFSTYQLAVLGADVIKVEAPDGPDMTRGEGVIDALNEEMVGTYFMTQNAGKRAITLDLKSEQGRKILKKLAAQSDVLVENYRAGKMDELGLGYDALAKVNPKLIYCSMTGFGQTGPKAKHPAYDVVIQAFSGLMSVNGEGGGAPVRVGPPIVDYGTGAQSALAISAALFQRSSTGKGQRIDVAMLDAALMLMSSHVTDTLSCGAPPPAHGNMHPKYAGYSAYGTEDGTLMIGAYTTRQISNLFKALGEVELAEDVAGMSRTDIRNSRDRFAETLERVLNTRSAQEWEDILNEAGVPAARVRSMREALDHEQVASRQVFQNYGEFVGAGETDKLPVAAFSYAHGGPRLDRPPPRMGQHTDEVLSDLGYSADDIARFRDRRVV